MNINEYKQMSDREENYWWHTGRMHIVNAMLEKYTKNREGLKILNVGCGTGGTIPTLEKYGKVTNVDISEEALNFLQKKGYKGTKIDDHRLPFKDSSFDVVIGLDVLEHIDHDRLSVDEWRRVLKKNGKCIITVPAHQFLWSGHDTSLQHYRRYTKKTLDWDMKKSNFNSKKTSYAIGFSFPMVVGFRMINKILGRNIDENTSYVDIPKPLNSLFSYLLNIESYVLKFINIPIGTTVLGIYEENE